MRQAHILDASALLAYLNKENGWDKVAGLLEQAVNGDAELLLHHIHLGEIYYAFYRRAGAAQAAAMLTDVRQLELKFLDRLSLVLLKEAGRIKAAYKLSYADALAVGLARLRNAELVSCDRREFQPLETAGEVAMLWVR